MKRIDMGIMNLCSFALATLLAACTAAEGRSAEPTTALTATISDALRRDAEQMAGDMGISVEEAIRRATLQDLVGHLNATLQRDEAATFGGLWIQNEPEYRIVVAFTRDGQRTIRPYVEDTPLAELVDLRTVRASLAELEDAERRVADLMRELGLPFSSAVDVVGNRVELWVTDQGRLDAALQEAGRQLPELVEVVLVSQPAGTGPAGLIPAPDLAFPQLRAHSPAQMTALLQGKLTLRDGCLRVVQNGEGAGYLVIWQSGYYLHDNLGALEIWDREGRVVARAGEEVRLGGGEISMTAELEGQLREPPPLRCPGPYWLMGEILHP